MTETRRSYADPCGVARALDAVGERWALLIVRELSLGPCRFGQLRAGLPDISPNVLSQRLRELETVGILRRYRLDPPAATTVYELTARGDALDPVLQALGRWGGQQPEIEGREMSTTSFVRSLRTFVAPDAPDTTFDIVVAGERYAFKIARGASTVVRGRTATPVATIAGDIPALRQALLCKTPITDLESTEAVSVTGDRHAAHRIPELFHTASGRM